MLLLNSAAESAVPLSPDGVGKMRSPLPRSDDGALSAERAALLLGMVRASTRGVIAGESKLRALAVSYEPADSAALAIGLALRGLFVRAVLFDDTAVLGCCCSNHVLSSICRCRSC